MQLKKNGLKLMKDTGSLDNALMENIGTTSGIKVGDTFVELMWTDRKLWVITQVAANGKEFFAQPVKTKMKAAWTGTEYPVYDENGKIETNGPERFFIYRYKNWWRYADSSRKDGEKMHLSFGVTTGYCDPSF